MINKQSMKLYTEEQVKEMIDDAHNGIDGYYDIFKKHSPIELPSDDELLFDATTWLHNTFKGKAFEFKVYDRVKNEAYNYNPVKLLKEYSIWIKSKIQGGNNEQ